jgi:hypothetical protein
VGSRGNELMKCMVGIVTVPAIVNHAVVEAGEELFAAAQPCLVNHLGER